jgi:hypothetical protein
LSASCHRRGKRADLRGKKSGSILASNRAGEPKELQWTSLHLVDGRVRAEA